MISTACSIAVLSSQAIAALQGAEMLPDRLVLRSGQLSKPVYAEVDEAIARMGGVWNARAGAHIFTVPYIAQLTSILSGESLFPATNPNAFFPTSDELAAEAIAQSRAFLKLPAGARGIEPHVGRGALVRAARAVRPDIVFDACEIDPANRAAVANLGVNLIGSDFLDLDESTQYDFIFANPPFSVAQDKFAWLTHTQKMLRMLKPGGLLIVILPGQIEFVGRTAVKEVREAILAGGRIEKNPEGAFKEVGTGAKTVTVYYGPGESAKAIAATESQSIPLTGENIFWRTVQARGMRVLEHFWAGGGSSYITDTGALINWSSQDACEAQSWLSGQSKIVSKLSSKSTRASKRAA